MVESNPEIGVKIEDYDQVNKNFTAYEEMKNMFGAIKSSLKLPHTATFTDTLKAVKKTLAKRTTKDHKDKGEKKKGRTRVHASRVALNKTKIDLTPSGSMFKKVSPNREISPAIFNGPSSARNDKSTKIVFSKISGFGVTNATGRFQPNQHSGKPKRSKKSSNSTSCKKRSPQAKKFRSLK